MMESDNALKLMGDQERNSQINFLIANIKRNEFLKSLKEKGLRGKKYSDEVVKYDRERKEELENVE